MTKSNPKRKRTTNNGPELLLITPIVDVLCNGLNPTVKVPFTSFRLLGNGYLGSSTCCISLDVPAYVNDQQPHDTSPLYHDSLPTIQTMPDAPYEDYEDPAYINHISDSTVTLDGSTKKRSAHDPLKYWRDNLRDVYLSEDLRWEGHGLYAHQDNVCTFCPQAPTGQALFRCIDCEGGEMLCHGCLLTTHRWNGLHRIEKWNSNNFFEKMTLKRQGYRFQMGHRSGEQCLFPQPAFKDDFVVLDVNGIHEIGLDFCGCSTTDHHIQLLHFRWFPATGKQPQSATTFRVLKHFQLLSFESKASVFEFYSALARETENTRIQKRKDRYRELLIMIREYQHEKGLKRGGWGHVLSGAAGTASGELAIRCPACPHPDLNLPEAWENVESDKRWLYSLYLAIDANFCLKRKRISSEEHDPSLNEGWAYFVNEKPYKDFLATYDELIPQPTSTCSNHNAVNADRSGKGLAATGVGTVDCARHDMKRPVAVADILKGERFVIMDYIVMISLLGSSVIELVISYDIACQWSIHLWDRMATYPRLIHINSDSTKNVHFLIPKFHLPAHIKDCQTPFSWNFNPNIGRTDGEGVERGWAHINPIATSTREMGPGSQRDTLDDHFGDWNWKKTYLMGISLLKKMKLAVDECPHQRHMHNLFVDKLMETNEKEVLEWKEQLKEWEEDHAKFNPFESSHSEALTVDAVRHALAKQEAAEISAGVACVMHQDVSASVLIMMGIDLENQQRNLRIDMSSVGQHSTENKKAKLVVHSNVLRRKVKAWITIQHLYTPALHIKCAKDNEPLEPEERPDCIPLYLPSSNALSIVYDPRLQEMEFQLWCAQANDALNDLRQTLQLRSYLYMDKDCFQRGQQGNTRSNNIISRCEAKIAVITSRYCDARTAILKLALVLPDKVGTPESFPELRQNDIKGFTIFNEDTPTVGGAKRSRKARQGGQVAPAVMPSEGRQEQPTWIWSKFNNGFELREEEALHDQLRIAFCKGSARADRWSEEVLLIQEEMHRVNAFFESRAQQWDSAATSVTSWSAPNNPTLLEGQVAYARQQAAQFREMKSHCEALWYLVPEYIQNRGQVGSIFPPESIEHESEATDV